MKKVLKGFLYNLIIIALIIGIAFGGYAFFKWWQEKDSNAVISFSKDTRVITWIVDDSVKKYELIVNNDVVKTYEDMSSDKLTFSLDLVITDDIREYYFYVVSYNSNGESTNSATFAYIINDTNYVSSSTALISHDSEKSPKNAKITKYGNIVAYSWDKLGTDTLYSVTIASSNIASRSYTTYDSIIDLSDYLSEDDIYYVAVGVTIDDTTYYTEGSYVNTESSQVPSKYTSDIYYFNGDINDHLVKNQIELNNLIYYSFIYKLTTIEFYAPSSYILYDSGNYGAKLSNVVKAAVNNIHETLYLSYSAQRTASNEYKLIFNYGEDVNTISNTKNVEDAITPSMYGDNFPSKINNDYAFASDNKFIECEVSTSEELYWVVESGATPKCVSGSSAETIYTEAKGILYSVINENMTPYQMALSVFDYISIMTTYDESVLDKLEISENKDSVKYRCFYLEGVIEDNIAVCDGLSKAYSLLLNMVGVETTRISGTVDSGDSTGGHAWNKVKVDNKWYVVDLTWANILVALDSTKAYDYKEYPTHEYFFVSDKTISDTHTPFDTRHDSTMPADYDMNYYEYITYTTSSSFTGSSRTINLIYGNESASISDYKNYTNDRSTSIVEIFVPKAKVTAFKLAVEAYSGVSYETITSEYTLGTTSTNAGLVGFIYYLKF